MRHYDTLPEGYRPAAQLDLLNNRRQLIIVTVLNLIIMAAMLAAALPGHPIHLSGNTPGSVILRAGVVAVGTLLYLTLHELTHGLVIRLCGAKPFYGFRVAYAYAGCKAYFPRAAYIAVALSPVILWGVVLAVLTMQLPESWFWPVYLIQMVNLSGAAGDYYVTYRILGLPRDTLVQDTGIEMVFYTR